MDAELSRLAERALSDLAKAAERKGHGDHMPWCHYCGTSGVPLAKCDCRFPEHFQCGVNGRLVCEECKTAHRTVASHLDKLFATKPVVRVSSLRAKYSRELSSAVRAIEGDDVGNPRNLLHWLAQFDDFEDDKERFRSDVLKAFRKSNFLDFQSLARHLKQQHDESLIRAIVRSRLFR